MPDDIEGGQLNRKALGSRLLLVMIIASMLLSAWPVSGANYVYCSEEHRITDDDDPDTTPRIGVDSEGDFHIIYHKGGQDPELTYRKVDGQGQTRAGPVRLNPTDVTHFTGWDVAVDSEDRVHVVFSGMTDDEPEADLYYVQLTKAGIVQVQSRRIYNSQHSAVHPSIDIDGLDEIHVAFEEQGVSETHWMKLTPGGTVSLQARRISDDISGNGGDVERARVGAGDGGTSFVVWLQRDTTRSTWGVQYTALTPCGEVDVPPQMVQYDRFRHKEFLSADVEGEGELHMLYVENGRLFHAKLDDRGRVDVSHYQLTDLSRGEVISTDLEVSRNDTVFGVFECRDILTSQIEVFFWVRWEGEGWIEWSMNRIDELGGQTPSVCAPKGDLGGAVFMRDFELYLVTLREEVDNQPPVAILAAAPTDIQVGETVYFDGTASHDPDPEDQVEEWRFEWGDGGDTDWITSPTATYAYSSPGTYTASLFVMDDHGMECEEPATISIYVTGGSTNKAPLARLSATPDEVLVEEVVTFDATASYDEDGEVATYLFEFGDGLSSGWMDQGLVTHVYYAAGLYTASLMVRDDEGAQSESPATVRIAVEEPNRKPTATIEEISPNPVTEGDEVTFRGSGSDSDGEVVEYMWSSGLDGILSDQASFTRSNLTVGVQSIVLTVRDDDGAWSEPDTIYLEVHSNQPPTIDVKTEKTSVDIDSEVEFRVTYTDPEGDMPTMAKVVYGIGDDEMREDMEEVDASDTDCRDGKDYICKVRLNDEGTYRYYFEFTNPANGKQTSEVNEMKVTKESWSLPARGASTAVIAMLVIGLSIVLRNGSRSTSRRIKSSSK
jgi:PKD repeat protein